MNIQPRLDLGKDHGREKKENFVLKTQSKSMILKKIYYKKQESEECIYFGFHKFVQES